MASTAELITRYSQGFNRMFLSNHGAASPLGVWLLLALIAPTSEGDDRSVLEAELGTRAADAAERAAALLAGDHPAIGCALAVWAQERFLNANWDSWRRAIPTAVEFGSVPDQRVADVWASEHSRGLIESFPIVLSDATALVLASALSTAVTWINPFRQVPASELGGEFGRLAVTALASADGHSCLLADTDAAGTVGVHCADSLDGLSVISVIAACDVPAGAVHDAAGQIGALLAGDANHAHIVSLFDLPLGEGAAWTIAESQQKRHGAMSDRTEEVSALLASWSATSDHDLLAAPGMAAVLPGLEGMLRPQYLPADFEAKQVATARYSRTGFTAAAVSALGMQAGAMPVSRVVLNRSATIRFNRPHAVVAIAHDQVPDLDRGWGTKNLGLPQWSNVPVFSAWVAHPSDRASG
ncbi:MAG: hypothetical protein WCP28_14925 [Actinomycetes bacterium]